MRQWLLRLCEVDSTSGREDAMLPLLRELLAEDLGAEVLEQEVALNRTNVLATWGRPKVLFTTHLDTVPPFLPPRLEENAIWGRGTCDAKGQIMAQLEAIRTLLKEGIQGLGWLGVVGEETDSAGAIQALGLVDRLPDLRGLVDGEPTGCRLATGQRGILHLCLRSHGRAAHSGSPELGRSAIFPLLDWLQALRGGAPSVDEELGPEVWNLGLIEGGESLNTVPADAEAQLFVRTLPDSTFYNRVKALQPPDAEVEVRLSEPPDRYPRLPGFEYAPMPFGSDAPRLRALVPDGTVVLAGPGSITVAHTLEEHLSFHDLAEGVELNRRLALHFLHKD
jgi:acetylornithine deacetylase